MSKFKRYHGTRTMKRMLRHWHKSQIGPFRQSGPKSQPVANLEKNRPSGETTTEQPEADPKTN